MKGQLNPAVTAAIIAVVVIVLGIAAWRYLFPPAHFETPSGGGYPGKAGYSGMAGTGGKGGYPGGGAGTPAPGKP